MSQLDRSKKVALSHILKILAVKSGKGVMYTAAILGIADLIPGLELPGMLGVIAGGIGVEAMGSIIERVASGDEISDDEIKMQVDTALAESGIDKLLTKDDFEQAFVHLQKGQKTLSNQINQVLRSLSVLESDISPQLSYFDYISVIPGLPEPYFAHPYPLQANFRYCTLKIRINQFAEVANTKTVWQAISSKKTNQRRIYAYTHGLHHYNLNILDSHFAAFVGCRYLVTK